MTDSHDSHSSHIEQTPLDSHQTGQAQNILDNQKSNSQADLGSRTEAQTEAIKDQIDDATPKGPKIADPSTGGRVIVGETGDLHDLAARRQS
ncbi:hypothetical protein F4803DRAFT_505569 [Xylaria telfairii]|nr:hypothetical protein F4803DRAFT_505569 [Xylaria telfairii]